MVDLHQRSLQFSHMQSPDKLFYKFSQITSKICSLLACSLMRLIFKQGIGVNLITNLNVTGFEDLTAVTMNVMPCRPIEVCRHYGIYYLLLQGRKVPKQATIKNQIRADVALQPADHFGRFHDVISLNVVLFIVRNSN